MPAEVPMFGASALRPRSCAVSSVSSVSSVSLVSSGQSTDIYHEGKTHSSIMFYLPFTFLRMQSWHDDQELKVALGLPNLCPI